MGPVGTYLLISSECTLYLLSILYLLALARESMATLFLYLAGGRGKKFQRVQMSADESQRDVECLLPDDSGVGPAADGTVQPHALLLPHGV